ncbi:TspO/MBR family protein [Mesonia sp. HuA40]|uniref:TspO/MBR family protein n=1 Tax=Mesonia sp. HuA40 TaxID=2602761 RepID=UPI0011C8A845|nr:TspO/MBR family protein [Mesonia sp. HuA40]TXK73572.1 tryptophan-rich sensory protein [Mesonia sp. HuA40]
MFSKIRYISLSVMVCLLVGLIASIVTQTSIDSWYFDLIKPTFTPPAWLFAPVWMLLYVLMGVAMGLVLNRGLHHIWVKTAIYHFGFQLLLNTAWSIVFFGLQSPFFALMIILALFVVLLFTFKWFKIASPLAAYLLIPYIAWVGCAAMLNFEIWRLN